MISGRSGLPKFRQLVAPIGSRAGAGDVARRLGDREHRAAVRIEIAEAAVAVDRQRQRARRALDAHHAGAHAGQHERVGADHVVVLPVDPALAGDRRRGEQPQRTRRRGDGGAPSASRSTAAARPRDTPGSPSAGGRPAPRRSARGSGISATTAPRSFTRSRPSSVTSPMCTACRSHFSKIRSTSRLAAALDDEQHALLRLGQHDLVRRHAGLALRHERRRRSRCRRRRASPSRRSSRSARPRPCPGCRRARRSSSPRGTPRAAASP